LDKFASEGILFRRAYVSCPQCVPSRAGIFASRSPVGIGMSRFSAAFPANIKTFPEYLRERGYFTGLAGRSYHMEGYSGKGDPVRNVDGKLEYRRFADRFDYAQSGNALAQLTEFLDKIPQEKPFYLQLCFSDPHRPYTKQNVPHPLDPDKLVLPSWFPDTPELRKDLAGYYDEINRFDRDFGKVLAELEKRSLNENTLIIFLGDNGGATLRGKGTLYEFGIHVPFIVRWAGKVAAGSRSDVLISAEDIGPTLLNIAGITPPKEWTGQSFLPVLQGTKDAAGRKYVFSERGPHGSGLPNNSAAFDLGRTIVGQRYKLIYNAIWQIPYQPVDFAGQPFWKEVQEAATNGKVPEPLAPYFNGKNRKIFELYDLQNDPNELNNLAGNPDYAEIETQLKQDLTEWMILERDFIPLPFIQPKNNNNRQRNNNNNNRQRNAK
jgi:arylsulfatase A-like enzyme